MIYQNLCSPTCALADLVNVFREPLCRVTPIGFHGTLGSADGTPLDLPDDGIVLGHRWRDLVIQRADVHPDVALGLRFDRLVEHPQPGPGRGVHIALMETVAEREGQVTIAPAPPRHALQYC